VTNKNYSQEALSHHSSHSTNLIQFNSIQFMHVIKHNCLTDNKQHSGLALIKSLTRFRGASQVLRTTRLSVNCERPVRDVPFVRGLDDHM